MTLHERRNWSPVCALLACAAAISCTGTNTGDREGSYGSGGVINAPGTGSAGSGAEPGGGAGPGALPPGTDPGGLALACDPTLKHAVSPLLKLSTKQYRNTVRDLLTAVGATQALPAVEPHLASVPDDSLGDSFRGLDARISLEHVQSYVNTATALGDAVLGSSELLLALAGDCASGGAIDEACISKFLESFVQRAYRRPVTAEEAVGYQSLNDGVRTPAEVIRGIIIVALTSPRFLNHVEIDGAAIDGSADLLQLTAYEIAGRLSYTFWQTMPDAELLTAAANGSLATEQGFAQQLQRVFRDDRTKNTLWQFWDEWLRLEKFTGFETARPAFQSLAAGEPVGEPGHDYYGDMVQELRDLTELFTFERSATLSDLLATDLSVTKSADLARLYGVAPYDGSGNYPRIAAGTRAGILQRGALLASNLEQTNPFHRGAIVRRHLLCDPLPQPDPNALPPGALDPPPVSAAQTTRQRFEAKVNGNDLCSACHAQFSDIGYVMEAFDSLGRYRTIEKVFNEQTGEQLAELPIDTTAVVRITSADASPVSGPAELNQRIIQSEKVEACMANHFFQFATRRTRETGSLDACAVEDLKTSLRDQKIGLAGAFERIAKQPSFFVRKVGQK